MKQAKYPAYLSVALFQSIQKTLVGFSKRFKEKQQRLHFIHLVLSIINQGSTQLKDASQVVDIKATSVVENLSRFLKNTAWSIGLLWAMHTSFLASRRPEKMYVAFDMTAIVKRGKKFEYLDRVHDGRDGKVKDGYNLLISLSINQANKKDNFILNHQLISAEHPSWRGENLEIIKHIKELKILYKKAKISLKGLIHLADRGFDRKPIIKALTELNCLFVIRAKDKNVTLKDGTWTKLYQLPLGKYHKVYIETWKMYLNLVVIKAKEKEEDRKERKMVLLTNIPVRKLSQRKAKKIYQMRWQIETCFKELKNDYGLEKFRVRKWDAIQKIIILCWLTISANIIYENGKNDLKGKLIKQNLIFFLPSI